MGRKASREGKATIVSTSLSTLALQTAGEQKNM